MAISRPRRLGRCTSEPFVSIGSKTRLPGRPSRHWKWAVSVELLTKELPALERLRFGHAREKERVMPVDVELVNATLPHLSEATRTMLRIMLLTGMRPCEVCDLRGCDINLKRLPWEYRPPLHKTRWLGKDRVI